jgi:hypothetical protein
MALSAGDPQTALRIFVRIGNNWDKEIWGRKEYFDRGRQWAENALAWTQMYTDLDANLKTPEGRRYNEQTAGDFDTRLSAPVNQCVAVSDAISKIDIFLQLDKDGIVQQVRSIPSTGTGQQLPAKSADALSACLGAKLKIAAFMPPPSPSYWVKRSLDIKP